MESISIREAAERLGVSHKVIRRLIAQGAVTARKVPGAHGTEWAVDAASLEAYRRRGAPVRSPAPVRSSTVPASPTKRAAASHRTPSESLSEAAPDVLARELETLREDRRFLQAHVETLTELLGRAMSGQGGPPLYPTLPGGGPAAHADASGPALPEGVPAIAQDTLRESVTAALQSALQTIGCEEVACLEMCSVRMLWGKPVLWRVVSDHPEDVSALLEAVLSPEAAWDPPGEEVLFLWARDASGDVLWGTACGAGWFGAPFQEALRTARVERR